MKRTIKLVVFVLVLIIVASITLACSGNTTDTQSSSKSEESSTQESQEPEKKIKIGFLTMDFANEFFVNHAEGFKARADELGIEYIVTDGKMDATVQINAIENYITAKVDLIFVTPVDAKALEPYVEKAHDAGIMFVSAGEIVAGSDAQIILPEHTFGLEGGRLAGQWMKDNLTGPVEVGVLDLPELEVIIDRANGLIDGVKELYPDAVIVANQSASTPETGMAAAEAILQAHPNVQVIVAINDAGALGAYEAFMAAGKNGDDIGIFGLDATEQAIAKIKEGGIYRGSVGTDPLARGARVVDIALQVLEEGPIEEPIIIEMFPVTYDNIKE